MRFPEIGYGEERGKMKSSSFCICVCVCVCGLTKQDLFLQWNITQQYTGITTDDLYRL